MFPSHSGCMSLWALSAASETHNSGHHSLASSLSCISQAPGAGLIGTMVEQTRAAQTGQEKTPIVTTHGERQSSLLNRIGTSTSALVQETVLPSQPDNVTAGLASSYGITTKGNTSSGPSGSSVSSPQHVESCYSAQAKSPSHQDSFRTQSLEVSGLAKLDFNSFLANKEMATNGIMPDYRFTNEFPCRSGKQESPQLYDGAAVIELLFDPNNTFADLSDSCVQDKFPSLWSPNAVSRELLDRIKADLPPIPMHRPPSPTNCLNLLPDSNSQRIHSTQTGIDIGPWLDVLTNYQDKVWGELLPLVEEAHEELRVVLTGSGTHLNDCPAVRRLGLILGHIHTPINNSQIVHL